MPGYDPGATLSFSFRRAAGRGPAMYGFHPGTTPVNPEWNAPMRAEIIAIGSELTSGQSLDTNSQWLSQQLSALGITVAFHTTLGDVMADHLAAFRIASDRADLVVMTGGLGPTQDDLTREALAEVAGVPLVEDPDSLAAIAAMFARRNRVMSDRNRVQALFPKGAEPLSNPVGTAPGSGCKLAARPSPACPACPTK